MANSSRPLPSGWRRVVFGDVVRNVNDNVRDPLDSGLGRFVGLEHIDPESLHIKRWGVIEEGTTFTRKFVKGQVLFGKRRAYQRKVAIAEFDGICSGDILVFEPANDGLLPELLPFIVQSDGFFEHALGTSAGSLSPRTKWQALARYEFALPPKDEQRRIAEILWAADEAIERFQACTSELAQIRATYFENWLVSNHDGGDWSEVTLEDVCVIQSGQVDPTESPYHNMIHIASDDIESNTGHIIEKKTAAEDSVKSGNYEFTADAILYSKIRPNLKKVALPDFPGVCSADMYPVYPKPNILRKFLFYLLLSEDFTTYATTHSVRSAIPKINRPAMLKYVLRLPPLDVQRQVVDMMSSFDVASRSIMGHLLSSTELKKLLLNRLLSCAK